MFPVAGPSLGLESKMAQFGGVVGVQHGSVGARLTERRVGLVERLVAARQQVQLWVVQAWVAVRVCFAVLVA